MKINKFKIKMIVLLSFLFIYNISFSIKIIENIEVEGVKVYLSDCIITTDKIMFQKASKITITRLPNPGEFIELSGERIASKLRTLTKKEFSIPRKVKIRRSFNIASRDEINEIIKEKLEVFYLSKPELNYDFSVNVGRKLRIPVGNVTYKLDESKLKRDRYGKFQVYLELYQAEELAQRIPFVMEISKIVSEYYLTKDVVKGEEFNKSHIEKKSREVFYDLKTKEFFIEKAIGNVYQGGFKSGYKIKNEDIGLKTLITKGKIVKLQLNFKGIVITDLAEAMEDGKVGEIISLKNIRSGKRIRGKVMADGSIEIEY